MPVLLIVFIEVANILQLLELLFDLFVVQEFEDTENLDKVAHSFHILALERTWTFHCLFILFLYIFELILKILQAFAAVVYLLVNRKNSFTAIHLLLGFFICSLYKLFAFLVFFLELFNLFEKELVSYPLLNLLFLNPKPIWLARRKGIDG